jgi:uncharacterized protein (DUF1501 family)
MLSRRDFLARSLKTSTLLACAPAVPQFLANTAWAADGGKDTVLVVLEMGGGNDGLNTVIPYGDDLYHKARPTLRLKKNETIAINDHIGLHNALAGLSPLQQNGQLASVLGVGYPNPDRSHFESMDIWQSADTTRVNLTGWLGRSVPNLMDKKGSIPALQIGAEKLPLALQGAAGGVVSLNQRVPYQLELGGDDRKEPRRKLIESLTHSPPDAPNDDLLSFVRRRQVQTYETLDKLREVLDANTKKNAENPQPVPTRPDQPAGNGGLVGKMDLIAKLIKQGFGTRVFYVSIDGFDTHSRQAEQHAQLLTEVGQAIGHLFNELKGGDNHGDRVLLMTFSEFGRRVKENGSKGTDHGAGSCLFVAGPAVKGGAVGEHPKLDDLDSGDLKYPIDFRRVYATLLDQWLGVDSQAVLGGKFEHLPLLKKEAKS